MMGNSYFSRLVCNYDYIYDIPIAIHVLMCLNLDLGHWFSLLSLLLPIPFFFFLPSLLVAFVEFHL